MLLVLHCTGRRPSDSKVWTTIEEAEAEAEEEEEDTTLATSSSWHERVGKAESRERQRAAAVHTCANGWYGLLQVFVFPLEVKGKNPDANPMKAQTSPEMSINSRL